MTTQHRHTDAERLALVEDDTTTWQPPISHAEKLEIQAAVKLVEQAQRLLDEAVLRARSNGLVWLAIGDALGVTAEAARKKYAHRVTRGDRP